MPRVGFEPTISAGEWPKTYALDGVATGTGSNKDNVQDSCIYTSLSTDEFKMLIVMFMWK